MSARPLFPVSPVREVTVRTSGWLSRGSARVWNQAVKQGLIAVLEYWHTNFLPKHFTRAGLHEYGYTERSARYNQKKKAFLEHTNPIDWGRDSHNNRIEKPASSTTKVMARERYKITATRDHGTIRMTVPTYLLAPQRIDMRKELTTVSSREMLEIGRVFAGSVADYINEKVPLTPYVPGTPNRRSANVP